MKLDRTLATSKTGVRFPGVVLIVLALMAGSHGSRGQTTGERDSDMRPIPAPSPSPFDEWARGRRP